MPKGWKFSGSLMFSNWKLIIQELKILYNLKKLINLPVSVPNNV